MPTAAHLLASAGAAAMEADPSGATLAELWRMWAEFEWRAAARPDAEEFLLAVEDLAAAGPRDDGGAPGAFEPRVSLFLVGDWLRYVLEHEMLDLDNHM